MASASAPTAVDKSPLAILPRPAPLDPQIRFRGAMPPPAVDSSPLAMLSPPTAVATLPENVPPGLSDANASTPLADASEPVAVALFHSPLRHLAPYACALSPLATLL